MTQKQSRSSEKYMIQMIENKTFDEINLHDQVSLKRRLTLQDIKLFATMSGDINPAHVDIEYAEQSMFHGVIAHGMWGGALVSTLLGTQLPGPGTIYLEQTLKFHRPIKIGDVVTVSVKVVRKQADNHHILFDCKVENDLGNIMIDGQATVLAPTEKVKRPRWQVPDIQVCERPHLQRLLDAVKKYAALPTAIVHPVDEVVLQGLVSAAEHELIIPILVGPEHKIKAAAEKGNIDLSPFDLITTEHSHAAAQKAVDLAKQHQVSAIMKGSLHTDEFMSAVVDPSSGLRTKRRMSHIFAFDVPTYHHPLFISDAALNIQPSLQDKQDIIQNAIDLARILGITLPKVAILSAVETVTPSMASTLDAAALCKMCDRGQIKGGIVDGPLAFDNAVSAEAASIKGISSEVAGQADILIVPDLESGNMLAKQLEYLGGAEGAGIVMGARIPIILTSRADDETSRLASCAIAIMLSNAQD